MSDHLTPEQARTVELPSWIHPFERIKMIGELATQTSGLKIVGWSPATQLAYSRRGLVRHAEMHERAAEQFLALQEARQRSEQQL